MNKYYKSKNGKAWLCYKPEDIENYIEITEEEFNKHISESTYPQRVEALIRERYSVSDEIAIIRQKDTKPVEYDEYYSYCEECKRKAKGNVEEIDYSKLSHDELVKMLKAM